MEFSVKLILAPLLGGVIGYITNDLAIKMLFRPRKKVYIGRFHVPFTPGLIPQQKSRIARSIGRVISGQLLDSETLRDTLLTESTLRSMEEKIIELFERYQDDSRTVEQFLEPYVGAEKLELTKETVRTKGVSFCAEKIGQAQIGARIAKQGISSFKEKMRNGMFARFFDEDSMKGAEHAIGKLIDDVIKENAPKLIEEEVEKLEEDLLKLPLCDIYASQKHRIPDLAKKLTELYKKTLEEHLEQLLEAVDVERIVVEKVNSFDAVQLEEMIFGIMKKELNAIVYLGALLGFMMGFVNLLF